MDRRAFLARVAALGGAALMPDQGVSDDPEVLGQRTAQLRLAYEAGEPDALARLDAHGHHLWTVFTYTGGSTDRQRWGGLFADSAQHLALVNYKAANYGKAQFWAEEAQRTALKISDPDLLGVAIVRRALALLGKGDPQGAVGLLAKVRGAGLNRYAVAMVEEHLARGYAARGHFADTDRAKRALDRAVEALDAADRHGDPRPAWAGSLTSTWLVYHRGDVLIASDPRKAHETLLLAGRLIPPSNKVTHAAIFVRRAEASLGMGEHEQAANLAAQALYAIPVGTAQRDVGRAVALRDAIALQAPPRILRELDEEIHRRRRVNGSTTYRAEQRSK
jgi:tetratricopeptide (TPR) repeat protein